MWTRKAGSGRRSLLPANVEFTLHAFAKVLGRGEVERSLSG